MPHPIRGLTLTHPWPLAFLHLGKDVENRTWDPRTKGAQLGMTIALHGGVPPKQGMNKKYMDFVLDWAWIINGPGAQQRLGPEQRQWLKSQEQSEGMQFPDGWHFRPGIVAVATLADVTRHSTSPWAAEGQYHLLLTDVTPLERPVPDNGFHQGLWPLQADALRAVEAQLGRSFA